MRCLALLPIVTAGALAQTPEIARLMGSETPTVAVSVPHSAPAMPRPTSIEGVMARVAENQDKASQLRREFTFHQKQLLRMSRGNGKVAREEKREYEVVPGLNHVEKHLARFEGRYESKGKYIAYDRPGYTYKEMDIDGELIDDLSNDLTGDRQSRDGLSSDLFPLTAAEQRKYNFRLLGRETQHGRDVLRVAFQPKPDRESDGAAWKGEAIIDAAENQPVSVYTKLAMRIPLAVKTLLGTDIKGLGFSVTYQAFDEGVWFPVSYGGEFEIRAVFFYKRTISVNLANSDFRRTKVSSNVTYVTEAK